MQFVVFMELAGTLVLPAAISFTLYLIIITILPQTNPKPIIPLILLGIILGLPGLLIVITSRKVAYLGWMLIYLMSLPIWNFVLPAYAFWHFDDFSWGQTRMVAGEKKELGHGDKDGEFDSSHIVMKRWAEFERDRRFRLNGGMITGSGGYGTPAGAGSRDSYDVVGRSSPKRESGRYSVGSTNETYLSGARARDDASIEPSVGGGGEFYRPRDNSPLVMLPAPLAVASRPNPGSPMPGPSPVFGVRGGPRDVSPSSSASPLTRSVEDEQAGGRDSVGRPFLGESSSARPLLQESSSGEAGWGGGPNPYRWSQQPESSYAAGGHDGFFGDGDEVRGAQGRQSSGPSPAPVQAQARQSRERERERERQQQQQGRGVSLVDPGPVTAPDGVKRVQKRRQSQQSQPPAPGTSAPANQRYSRSSQPQSPGGSSGGHQLPPGAAPPNPRNAYSRYQ